MYYIKFLSIAVLMVSLIHAAERPAYITIQSAIFDQHPYYNMNFEGGYGSLTKGLVKSTLNSTTKIPELASIDVDSDKNKAGKIKSIKGFEYLFQSNADAPKSYQSFRNYPINQDLVLKWNENNQVYEFNNQDYFPINNRGFDDSTYGPKPPSSEWNPWFYQYPKNFHFCLKLKTKFTYRGYEKFNFTGDDDVFVYINNKLVIDLGGIHEAEHQIVDVTSLGLTIDQNYDFDFFYCERHTVQSTIRIQTNLEIFCTHIDFCGVCGGDGSTCCTASRDCNDGKGCTNDFCPNFNQVIAPGKTFKDYCSHTPVNCDKGNQCSKYTCVESNGIAKCQETKKVCEDRSNECLGEGVCYPETGCQYKNLCPRSWDSCNTGVCDGKGGCLQKTEQDCFNSGGSDPMCKTYTCFPGQGCVAELKCMQGINKCIATRCNSTIGECYHYERENCKCCTDQEIENMGFCNEVACDSKGMCAPKPKTEIDDGNKCTIDECHESNSTITHTKVKCSGCETCDPATGLCSPSNDMCDDGNSCTDNICQSTVVNGTTTSECVFKKVNCDDGDKCKIWSCDLENGGKCVSEPKVCEDIGKCSVGTCDSSNGECKYSPRVCHSPAFCIIAECDEQLGCLQYPKRCSPDDGRCQAGVCVNETDSEEGHCDSEDFDPKPFICQTAAVVSTAVVAGVTVAGAVALGAFIYGGKKGYDYWKTSQGTRMAGSTSNPLYVESQNGGVNPLYTNTD